VKHNLPIARQPGQTESGSSARTDPLLSRQITQIEIFSRRCHFPFPKVNTPQEQPYGQ